jgi:DNA (cytosine-5)-methyltransferase 1
MKKLCVASMFAGIGGICTAFKQADCTMVWANEIDKAACDTYRYNWGDTWLVEGDVRRIAPAELPDMDILTAGFPCQSFSIAGAQKGFNDPRGNLFFEIARIVDTKRPRAIFLENVDNLAEHDNGKTFLVIYTSLAQFGYIVKYRMMSAHQYGNLPQPRRRIYIAAFLDMADCNRFSFPEPMDLTVEINDVIIRSERKHDIYYYGADSRIFRKYGGQIRDRHYIYRIADSGLIRVRNHLCPTLTANMGTYPDRAPIVCDDYGIRKLTLRECLDFQGFPQDFRFSKKITINDAYKQIGNSVCVPVIRRIAINLCDALLRGHSYGG